MDGRGCCAARERMGVLEPYIWTDSPRASSPRQWGARTAGAVAPRWRSEVSSRTPRWAEGVESLGLVRFRASVDRSLGDAPCAPRRILRIGWLAAARIALVYQCPKIHKPLCPCGVLQSAGMCRGRVSIDPDDRGSSRTQASRSGCRGAVDEFAPTPLDPSPRRLRVVIAEAPSVEAGAAHA